MEGKKKREYSAWLISVGLHLVVFVLVSLTGLFVMVSPEKDNPIDVMLYNADAGGHQGGGAAAAGEAVASAAASSAPEIVISDQVALPEITEDFTKTPELQEKFKKEHHAPQVAPQVTGLVGQGVASGAGKGESGTGNGTGDGLGTGSGTGQGSGEGTGSGNGSGSEPGLRPAIPPQRIYAPEPEYPSSLRRKNVSGSVAVRITVNTAGTVSAAELLESSGHKAMDQAAMEAAWQYQYTPAYNEYGEAVSFTKRIRVEFVIQ